MVRRKRDRIFYSFLRSYLFLLIFIVGIGAVSYMTTLGVVERDIREANFALLDQSRRVLEGRFSEVENILSQLACHPQVTRLTYTENPLDGGSNVVEIQELQDLLIYYKWNNSFLSSLQLFLEKSGIIITSEDIYLRKDLFYNHFFQYGTMDNFEWSELLFTSHHHMSYLPPSEVLYGGNRSNLVTILQSVSIKGYGLTKSGVIAGFIREEAIAALLESTLLRAGGASFILDESSRLIASTGNLELAPDDFLKGMTTGSLDFISRGERVILTSMISPDRGWTYVNIVPRKLALKKMVFLRRIIILIFIISLLAGLGVSIVLARRTSAPLRAIRGMLSERSDLLTEGRSPEGFPLMVEKLLNSNRGFREQIVRQNELLKISFLESLIRGKYYNEEEAALHYSLVDNSFLQFPLAVVSVRFLKRSGRVNPRTVKEFHAYRLVVQALIQEFVGTHGICHDTGPDTLVILRYTPEPRFREAVESFAGDLLNLLVQKGEADLLLTCGARAEAFCQVSSSFREVEKAQDHLFLFSTCKVRWADSIPVQGIVGYTIDVEKKLMNYVLAGDRQGVEGLLLHLKEYYFILSSPSYDGVKQFRHDIRSTLVKIKGRISLTPEEEPLLTAGIEALFSFHLVELFFEHLVNVIGDLADRQRKGQKSHNSILKDKLTAYLDEHFDDSQLYLGSVADHFHLSEVYLSQFFKEQTGEKFSVYLERIRISHSCILMTDEEKSLSGIAAACGYNSPQVFRRAFKRLEGVSPSQFREKLLKKAPLT